MGVRDPKGGSPLENALDSPQPAPKVGRRRTQSEVANDEPALPFLDPRCPVTPLGKQGLICHFLDEQKQLISLDPQKIGKNHIRALFGRKSHLCDEIWPRIGQNGHHTGWMPEVAGDLLMRACAVAGIFDPQGRVRGRGAWTNPEGDLILHCGDKIYMTGPDGGWREPDLIGRYVYPAGAELPRPSPQAVGPALGEKLAQLFKSWSWARPEIDPLLLLGWNAAAMIGGALEWRPHIWVTGSTATGKSTLQRAMELLHNGAALQTADATEAALRQLLKQDALPVFFDEAEAEEDNRRNKQVTKLARLASGGGQALRGSQTHEGAGFTVRSCFLFSSILLPPMQTQDRNRLALLELNRIPVGQVEPVLDPKELNEWGEMLRKRLVDHWPRYRELYLAYAKALAAKGHDGRGQKQFGTLLALADLVLYDAADEENIEFWANRLKASTLAEKANDEADEEEAAQFLATSMLHARGGDEPEPVSRTIVRALHPEGDKARERLENHGLRVVAVDDKAGKPSARHPTGEHGKELYLAIASKHVGLAKLFQGTRWSEGTWQQSFARIEGAHRHHKLRIAGTSMWATLVPLTALIAFDEPKS
jgi:hypothetical protein